LSSLSPWAVLLLLLLTLPARTRAYSILFYALSTSYDPTLFLLVVCTTAAAAITCITVNATAAAAVAPCSFFSMCLT